MQSKSGMTSEIFCILFPSCPPSLTRTLTSSAPLPLDETRLSCFWVWLLSWAEQFRCVPPIWEPCGCINLLSPHNHAFVILTLETSKVKSQAAELGFEPPRSGECGSSTRSPKLREDPVCQYTVPFLGTRRHMYEFGGTHFSP